LEARDYRSDKFFRSASDDERIAAWDAENQFRRLSKHIRRVKHGLALLNFSEFQTSQINNAQRQHPLIPKEMEDQLDILIAWRFIAARDILITIDDFYRSLTAFRALLQRCKSLWTRFSYNDYELIRSDFELEYPDHLDIRDAACHEVDYSAKPHNIAKNATKEDVDIPGMMQVSAGSMLTSNLCGREIVYSGNGRTLKLLLTDDILVKLDGFLDRLLGCFLTDAQ
jgi:hypothetical protein